MRVSKYTPILASLSLAFASGTPAVAQVHNMPRIEMQSTSVNLGVGGQSGNGILRLPNLGTNCAYPFKVDGIGAGLHFGVSNVNAGGEVKNMTTIEDLSGQYNAMQGEATLIGGAGAISMKNRANNVVIDLQSQTQGLALGFGAQDMTIKVDAPPANAPHVYVLEFGFNKNRVGEESRAKLAQAVSAWKCRYANIELIGHTDTVGNDKQNLELANQHAEAVRDYLVDAGFVPTRIATRAVGPSEPLVATGQGVRARSNRAVVLLVK